MTKIIYKYILLSVVRYIAVIITSVTYPGIDGQLQFNLVFIGPFD